MTYWSRSRNELWTKGDTSGHYQFVKSLTADCDKDTILAKVLQTGAACHTGARSCFFNEMIKREYSDSNPLKVFESEYATIVERRDHPKEGSYTNYLFDKGIDKILKKVGEENTEIIIAAKNPNPEEIKYEVVKGAVESLAIKAASSSDTLTEAETYDAAAIRIRISDNNGNTADFFDDSVSIHVSGDIELIGSDTVPVRGGYAGCYIRSCGVSGEGTVVISAAQLEPVTLEFKVLTKTQKGKEN